MFQKSSFITNILTLMAGTSLAQLISVLVAPVLTRIYSPDDFGVLSLFNFVVLVPSVMACWSYEQAIVLPEDEKEAVSILVLSILITCLMAGIMQLSVPLFGKTIVNYLNAPQLSPWLAWVGVSLFAVGIYQALNYWNNRKKIFKMLSISRMSQSGITAIGQIGGGMYGVGAGGLVLGQLAGQAVASGVLLGSPQTGAKYILKHRVGLSDLKNVFRRYKKFPLYSTWGNLMNVAASQVVPVVLSGCFSTAVAGSFFLGYRLINVPTSLVGSSIGQVFFQKTAAEAHNIDNISRLVEKLLSRLIVYFAIPFLLIMLFAPEVFRIVFGNEWRTAGTYVRILTPLFFIQFITSPLSVVLVVREKQDVLLIIQALLLIGSIGSLVLSRYVFNSPTASISFYSLTQSAVYAVYLMLIIKYSLATKKGIFRELLSTSRLI